MALGQSKKVYRKALRTVDLNEKIKLLNEVIALEPKNFDAYFYRAIAKNDLGDYHGAIVDYSKILVTAPDADTYYNRGNSRYSLKDYTGAKEDYQKAYDLDANFIDALYSVACTKYDLEEFKEAITDFTKVIKAAPNQPKAYTLRAHSYVALKEHKKALKDYTTAIFLESSADNYYARGVFYLDVNFYKKARTDFSIALKLNDKNSYAYFYRGVSNLLLGKYNHAVTDFSTALKIDETDFDALIGLALAYYNLNDANTSNLYLKKAKDILSSDQNTTLNALYINTYWHQKQFYYFNTFINATKNN